MPRVTITIPERTPQPYRFDLLREIVTIGRGLDNDIVVGCGSVSGKHSEMRRVKGGYEVVDMGSTNGIKIDGIRRQTVVLHTGMTVKLGDVEFGFTLSEEELAELATESEATTKAAAEEKEDAVEKEVPSKPSSQENEVVSKVDEKEKDDDGPDKLPDLRPVRLDKRKEKEEQEAEKRKKEERKEREKREKEARAENEEKSEKRGKREKSAKDKDRDEFAESKAVTIGSGFILFTLIAAAAAFFYGAQERHKKDTGENLLKGIVNKEEAKKDAPTEVEAKPEGESE